MNYNQYILRLASDLGIANADIGWSISVPAIIDYAEQRLYRELDLLATVVRDSSSTTAANSRNFTLPTSLGRFVVVNSVNIVTPSGASTTTGSRNPAVRTSLDYIDLAWPSNTASSAATIPVNYAMITDQTIAFGPPPGAAFTVEVVGTIRPTPLSAANSTTYLSLYLPDLFLVGSLIFSAGYVHQFGAPPIDAAKVQAWEAQYEALRASANIEEHRKRFASGSWPAPAQAQAA